MTSTAPDPLMLDRYISGSTPAMPVSHGSHETLTTSGHRYLVAREGLFVEVARPWVRAVLRAGPSLVPLPFGSGERLRGITLHCGQIPTRLLDAFVAQARHALPNECGAWIVWHEASKAFRLIPLKPIEATADRLTYERPMLEADWHLVLDVHSHGSACAFFSSTDDRDDSHTSEVKVAGVVGQVHTTPQWLFRFAACGLFEEISQ